MENYHFLRAFRCGYCNRVDACFHDSLVDFGDFRVRFLLYGALLSFPFYVRARARAFTPCDIDKIGMDRIELREISCFFGGEREREAREIM